MKIPILYDVEYLLAVVVLNIFKSFGMCIIANNKGNLADKWLVAIQTMLVWLFWEV